MRPEVESRLVAALREHPEVVAGNLFGSHARGSAGDGSDVDVAVIFPLRTGS